MSAPLAATAHGSDAEYRAIFEASSDGLVVNDLDTGIVLAANPAFCRMHGYDQMAGLHPSIFIHPSSLPLFGAFMRAVRAGEEFRCQAQDVRQDGTLVDVEVLGRTFTYRGKPATLGVVRDVTERVRAYEVLEQRVAERTREIEHRKEVAESMRELLAVVNSRRPLDQVLDDVLRQAARLLGTDAEMLYLVDERDPSVLRLQASRNLPPGGAPPSVARGTPTIGLAADRGLPVVAADLPLLLAEPSVATVDEQVHDRGAYLELVSRGPASAGDPLGQRGQGGIADLFGSAVAVPMVARGTCYGSLLLAHRERRVPSDDELGLIAAFASQAGLAIESARLQEQADRRLRELEALYEADGEMHSSLRLDDVLQALADVAASMLRGDKTSVLMWDAQHTRLTVHAAHGFAPETIALMSFAPGEGISARVAASGEPIAVYDVRADPRIPPRIQAINEAAAICSLVSVPIKLSGQVFGVFNVNCTERRTFSSDEQRVLAALAQRAAQAIQNARFYQQAQHTAAENARLHDEAERQRLELAALYHADEALHRSLRLDQVLLTLVDAAIALLNADGGGLWGPDPRPGGGVVPLAARGISADYLRQTVILIEDPTVRDWWAQETLAVEDVARHPGFPPASRQALEDEGYRAILNTTVRVGDQVFGTFSIGWRKPHTFSESEQRLFTALGQRAGLAIHNARLHEESERQRQELEALYRADEQIYGSLRVQEVLDALVDVAAGILRPDKVAVGIWDERSGRVAVGAARGFNEETVAAWVPPDEAAALMADLEGGVVVMEDVWADPRLPASIRSANEREGVRSTMTAPIRAGTAMIGAFGLSYCQPRTFSTDEQRLLQALAQRAALAIQNARLYEQAQQAATLEERQRLARELHDAVTQTLFSTALIAEVLPELWDLDPDEGRQRLAELRRLTRGALAEMRTLLVELRPGGLTELPLGDLLRQLAEATVGRTRLEVAVRVEGHPRPLPPAVQMALYRIAQEALNNVVKHAQARKVSLSLLYEGDGAVRVRLTDDGRGFDPSAIPAGHLGVGIMRERADSIGAGFQLTSRPGAGSTIDVSWQELQGIVP